MNRVSTIAIGVLVVIFLLAVGGSLLAPAHYAKQFRENPDSPPSSRFLLGTDDLGRDRFARLMFATRVSLLLAPAAAAFSTLVAAMVGTVAGYIGGNCERLTMAAIDVFLSLPWLFLLITARAMLPLNSSPWVSVAITFTMLALLGWATTARVVCAGVRSIECSTFMLNARALGCSPTRLVAVQLIPNIRPVLWAKFLVSIPAFILAEANLSILGLGVPEPVPSLGGMIAELENVSTLTSHLWRLAPLAMLALCVGTLQVMKGTEEVRV